MKELTVGVGGEMLLFALHLAMGLASSCYLQYLLRVLPCLERPYSTKHRLRDWYGPGRTEWPVGARHRVSLLYYRQKPSISAIIGSHVKKTPGK
jgi:hypothetical protein